MNITPIFVINYILYMLNSMITEVIYTYLLTPKYSRIKTIFIFTGFMMIGGTAKFLMPLNSDGDIFFAIFNSAMMILLSYFLCKEGILACLLTYCCVDMALVIESLIWMISPYAECTNWEIGTAIGYIIVTPMIIVEGVLLVMAKRYLVDKNIPLVNSKTIILLLLMATYYVMYTYVPIRTPIKIGLTYGKVTTVMEIIAAGLFLLILYMIFKKGMEQQLLKRCQELEQIRAKEQEAYENLLKRTEKMEKIRHDFYEQLTTARYIINQDKEKGMTMLAELDERLAEWKNNG